MKFTILAISVFVVAKSAEALNPYIPVFVIPKTPVIQCPLSCSSAKDCFFVHPMSETHFYSCFHGKAIMHQCPIGRSFNDEKHQCVEQTKQSSPGRISNAKVAKLTEKIAVLETLIESFQEKMNKVQKVIIKSDNNIGMLGKFLVKALKTNREQYCSKQSNERPDSEVVSGFVEDDTAIDVGGLNGVGVSIGNDDQAAAPAKVESNFEDEDLDEKLPLDSQAVPKPENSTKVNDKESAVVSKPKSGSLVIPSGKSGDEDSSVNPANKILDEEEISGESDGSQIAAQTEQPPAGSEEPQEQVDAESGKSSKSTKTLLRNHLFH